MPKIGQGRSLFDDTPVNGQLEKGISSNWAFDENVTLRALIEATLPWTIFINPLHTPKSNTNWNTIALSSNQALFAFNLSGGVQNAEMTHNVVLGAGTWSIELLLEKHENAGIISVQFDGVEKGTIDAYAASPEFNALPSIANIIVPITKKIELKLKLTGKNGSSSGYYGYLTSIKLQRTA